VPPAGKPPALVPGFTVDVTPPRDWGKLGVWAGLLAVPLFVCFWIWAKLALSGAVTTLGQQIWEIPVVQRDGRPNDESSVQQRVVDLAAGLGLEAREVQVTIRRAGPSVNRHDPVFGDPAPKTLGPATSMEVKAKLHGRRLIWTLDQDYATDVMFTRAR
jgi:hypothetical protein